MIRWRSLKVDEIYRLDLIQESSGFRCVKIRHSEEKPHECTAMSSLPYSGSVLMQFHANPQPSSSIVTDDGRSFGLDAHGVWMTQAEVEYWKTHRSQDALSDPNAPWVNGLPPLFAPS